MTRRGISGPKVEETWNRVMEASEDEYARILRGSGAFQEELSGFVVAATYSLRPEVSAMAREMMACVYAVYREHAQEVRQATEEAVVAQWTASKRVMAELQALVDAGEGFESLVYGHLQPALMATVLGVLLDVEPDDDGNPLPSDPEGPELSDDEFWHLLGVFHTVLGVLESHAIHRGAA